jgi:hypothetical protein
VSLLSTKGIKREGSSGRRWTFIMTKRIYKNKTRKIVFFFFFKEKKKENGDFLGCFLLSEGENEIL